jgi:hypothetical protein
MRMNLTLAVSRLAAILVTCVVTAIPMHAQSLCDLVPASVVQSTLGITTPLTAMPNTEGGNGCDYKGKAAGPIWIKADTSDYTGIYKTMQDQQFTQLPYGSTLVPGLGDKAYYSENHDQNVAGYQLNYTKQALVFVAKGKIVSFIFMLLNQGAPKANVLALGKYALAKPIETLKMPQ